MDVPKTAAGRRVSRPQVHSIDIDSIYVMRRGSMTRTDVTPAEAVGRADVVVLGVPSPKYKLPVAQLKKGAVVINVSGFKNLGEPEDGDDAEYTYIPLVGRVTVACLERNLLTLYKQYHVSKLSLKRRVCELAHDDRARYGVAAAVGAAALVGLLKAR